MSRQEPIETTASEIRGDRGGVLEVEAYRRGYSEAGLWRKLHKQAQRAGVAVVEKALTLFYALQDPEMPLWSKAIIVGALGYFILPADLIPDFIPGMGFSDDLAALASAMVAVDSLITDEVRQKAHAKVRAWFPRIV